MRKQVFEGNSVEECIEKAVNYLNIERDKLKYTVLKEKKGLFSKFSSISVEITDTDKKNNGTVLIKDGQIIIKNAKGDGTAASIVPSEGIFLFVDDKQINSKIYVTEESKIEIKFEENEAIRELKINITPDKMECYLNIKYTYKAVHKLEDSGECNNIILKKSIQKEIYPPLFTEEEIMEELKKNNVVYGLIDENIKKATSEKNITNLLVAKGNEVIDDEDDILEILFETNKNKNKLEEDKKGRVDFKSIGFVKPVKTGEILVIKKCGNEGKDGKEITGKLKKRKSGKKINLRTGNGCEVVNNQVVATIEGKPCLKGNLFCVFEIHEINGDVDIKTGNIKFIGDIRVHGAVKEGMKIEAGNSIDIEKNVERAEIKSKGDININGNIISSSVYAGGEDILNINLINNMEELKENIKNLIDTVMEIKKFNLLGTNISDGEIIKVLIEKKFKNINKMCLNLIKLNILKGIKEDPVSFIIKQKLMGISPLSIKHFGELESILEKINESISDLQGELSLPVNVNISYCQDSKINSSGDIIICGKGEYVSKIDANRNVYFTGDNAVARGGSIKASKEIICRTVGSTAGVTTKLHVQNNGHIKVDKAYPNTIFILGGREYLLTTPSKNVHAYIDDKGEIVIDKLKL